MSSSSTVGGGGAESRSASPEHVLAPRGDAVLLERRGQVLLITLNRPEARNAVNLALAEGVASALDELDRDRELRVGVLTGAGKGFCAGMDLKALVNGERPVVGDRGFAGICRRSSNKPVIAAVEGFAIAGGLEIALSCDLIVASREASFGIPEVKRGLVAAAGGLIRLPRQLPPHVAMYLALTGDPIDAQRAYDLGLVNELTEPGAALEQALSLAARILANAPLAVEVSKSIIIQTSSLSEESSWELHDRLVEPVFASADATEGATAFAERRLPHWKGI